MQANLGTPSPTWAFSLRAREVLEQTEGRPLFRADWSRALFIHYEVDSAALQPFVPFDLDLRAGRAYVSLVAFTLDRMRPGFTASALGEWLLRPISACRFLNLRAYVVCDGEPGIYFLGEWLSRHSNVPLGPLVFGLPYRAGMLDYRHDFSAGAISGNVLPARGDGRLAYSGSISAEPGFRPSAAGSLSEFLLERYTAFTEWRARRRLFRVWHDPWPQLPIELDVEEDSLLSATGAWAGQARRIGAHFSPGVSGVWMGRPQNLS